ncbi:MAG: glycosyltransferase family 2 protein, partial [Cyanobacteria bacterium P01_F01_bin.42]
ADAMIAADLLRSVVPFFERESLGALQVRKSITNADTNFLTRGQQAEMTLDAFIQQQRVATGGLGELRGNGQFVRKQALEHCGGWNEMTITDDLDLTFRLQLSGWDIDLLSVPAVEEEGVTSPVALWHQRNRWAEGGYQRYLDYWPLLANNQMGRNKTFDMVMFYLTQYALPTAVLPDMLMAIARHRLPLFMPMTSFTVVLSFVGTWVGLRQVARREQRPTSPMTLLIQAVQSTIYMFHWFPVVASVTARVSIRPKRLKWVKTQRVSGYSKS